MGRSLAGALNAVSFLAAPQAADGQVGRGCQYPTPVASLAGDRQSPRVAKQNGKVNRIAGVLAWFAWLVTGVVLAQDEGIAPLVEQPEARGDVAPAPGHETEGETIRK